MASPMHNLPEHLAMPLNFDGEGPETDPRKVERVVCWCGQPGCQKWRPPRCKHVFRTRHKHLDDGRAYCEQCCEDQMVGEVRIGHETHTHDWHPLGDKSERCAFCGTYRLLLKGVWVDVSDVGDLRG